MLNSRTYRSIARKLDERSLSVVTIHATRTPLATIFHAITISDTLTPEYVNVSGAVELDNEPVYSEVDLEVTIDERGAGEGYDAAFGVFTMAVAGTTI